MTLPLEHQLKEQHTLCLKKAMLLLSFKIKKARLERKLTVTEVAVETGMNESVICRIETGGHPYKLCTIYPLIVFFDLCEFPLLSTNHAEPTREDWKKLDEMQKQFSADRKSKEKIADE